MTNRLDFLNDEIKKLKEENRFIKLRVLQSPQEPIALIDGKKVINLTSNNYLCFANDPYIKQKAVQATEKYGVGSAAVRTIIGTMSLHDELETRLAAFKNTEASLVLQSGFCANTAVCQTLMNSEEDFLISDQLNHASIIDGARLAKAKRGVYKHSDMEDLERVLKSDDCKKARRRLVVTDGVFSMDGDIAKLPEIVALCEKYNAVLMVDDAHSSGVLGANGKGTVDHFGLKGRVDIQIGTLSKAFASIGGYVSSTQAMRDYMISNARPFLFSSSHPPSVLGTCLAGLDILEKEPQRIKKLWDNTKMFKEELKKAGFDTGKSETPITPVMVGDAKKAMDFSALLFERGVFALHIGFPTVEKGKARLRTIMTSGHEIKDLEKTVEIMKKTAKELGVI